MNRKTLVLAAALAVSAVGSLAAQNPAPRSFQLGAATFTPGGFLDLTGVYRSTDVGSGIGTSFGAIPFPGTTAGELSEFRFSAQNSRLSLRVDAHPGQETLTAYVEADFLGNAPGNLAVTSNSNTLRMRLYWVDLERGSWEILAGQSWSLLTPNRKGLSPSPADVFYTLDMDTNYQVGLTWSRDPQVRVVRHFGPAWALGVALENPEQYIGGAGVVALPAGSYSGQFGTGGNPSTPNRQPDMVAKLAYDGQAAGLPLHAELAGLLRGFRDVTPDGERHGATGGGVSLNGNIAPCKNFRLIASSFFSDGGGRYIFGLGPDLVVRPDGTISPVHAASGVGGFEWQAMGDTQLYGYYGGAYFQRNFSAAANGDVGFGFPGAAASANRAIQEATLGLIRTFWKRPAYGSLALITQYSYLTRAPWSVAPGAPTRAKTNMVWADLRYSLP